MDLKKEILWAKKTVRNVCEIENEKIYHLLNSLEQELRHTTENTVLLNELKKIVGPLIVSLRHMLKKETDFILPYTEKVLEMREKNDPAASVHYRNLVVPVKQLIEEQGRILAMATTLKDMCKSGSSFTEANCSLRIMMASFFDLAQLIERHVYSDENILFPSFVRIMEQKENLKTEIKSNSHVAI